MWSIRVNIRASSEPPCLLGVFWPGSRFWRTGESHLNPMESGWSCPPGSDGPTSGSGCVVLSERPWWTHGDGSEPRRHPDPDTKRALSPLSALQQCCLAACIRPNTHPALRLDPGEVVLVGMKRPEITEGSVTETEPHCFFSHVRPTSLITAQ